MKTKAFILTVVLLCGCASQKTATRTYTPTPSPAPSASHEAKFAGRGDQIIGEEAEAIWAKQLAGGIGGLQNKAIIRAIRGEVVLSNDQGKTWRKARVGAVVNAGSRVWTAEQS